MLFQIINNLIGKRKMTKFGFSCLELKGNVYNIGWYVINGVVALVALGGLVLICRFEKPCKNYQILLGFTISLLVGSCAAFTYLPITPDTPSGIFYTSVFGQAIWIAALNVAQWLVAQAYLKSSIEMNALLDKEVHLDNFNKIAEVFGQKRHLFYGSIVAVLLSIIDGYLAIVGVFTMLRQEYLYWTIWDFQNGLQLAFLALWAVALCRLATKIKTQPDLMPNKRLFFLHATMTLLTVGCSIAATVLEQLCAFHNNEPACIANSDLIFFLALIFQSIGFMIALYLLMPAKNQEDNRPKLNASVLKGFLNPKALEKALFAQNPDLSIAAKEAVNLNVQRLVALLENAESQESVMSSMVIANPHELGFYGRWKLNRFRSGQTDSNSLGLSGVSYDAKTISVLTESQRTGHTYQHFRNRRLSNVDSEDQYKFNLKMTNDTVDTDRNSSIQIPKKNSLIGMKRPLLTLDRKDSDTTLSTTEKKPWEYAPSKEEIAKRQAERKKARLDGIRHSDQPMKLRGKDLLLQPITVISESPIEHETSMIKE